MPRRAAAEHVSLGPRRAQGCAGVPSCLVPLAVILFAVTLAWGLHLGGHVVGWLLAPVIIVPTIATYRRWLRQAVAGNPATADNEPDGEPVTERSEIDHVAGNAVQSFLDSLSERRVGENDA